MTLDIYNYFNSNDVAAHCKKVGKTWNTLEMAVIIYLCSKKKLSDKHAAYRELLSGFPDMPLPKSCRYDDGLNIRSYLLLVLQREERVLEYFYKPEQEAVYRVDVSSDALYTDYYWEKNLFSSFDKALKFARKGRKREEIKKIIIEKRFLDREDKYVSVEMNYFGEPFDIDWGNKIKISGITGVPIFSEGLPHDFSDFYIDIPAPFKTGDVLTGCRSPGNESGLIVLTDEISCNIPEGHNRLLNNGGDISAMTYSGYSFITDSLFWDWHAPYINLEYFRGELQGKERLLQCVSLLLREEISIGLFSVMQNKIMMEHWLNELPATEEY